nr:MAG TPA: hypothetical protein [Caudoviricetes sp.]
MHLTTQQNKYSGIFFVYADVLERKIYKRRKLLFYHPF